MVIKVQVSFPKLHLEGQYDVNMKVLVVPIIGKGKLVLDASKLYLHLT